MVQFPAENRRLLSQCWPEINSYASNTLSVSGSAAAPFVSIAADTASIISSTNYPTAASGSVNLSNNGTAPTTLTLSTLGGSTVSPTSLYCPASNSCGKVTVTSPATPGGYSGSLTITSSAGGTVPTVSLSLNVAGPQLTLTSCSNTSPTWSPTAAVLTCTLKNSGSAGANSVSYNTIPGITVSGPTGQCAAGQPCGTVTATVADASVRGTYNITLIATPNVGTSASTSATLVVKKLPSLSLSRSPSPMVANNGYSLGWSASSDATAITYNCTAAGTGFSGSGSVSPNVGTVSGTASAAWVGFNSSCAWTVAGPDGNSTQTETLVTVNPPGTFTTTGSTTTGPYTRLIIIGNSGTGTITGISASCSSGNGPSVSSVSATTLAPNSTIAVTVSYYTGGFAQMCRLRVTGTNASNTPYVDSTY